MNTTVYVVTHGDYSGRHIVGVFSDVEAANALAKLENWGETREFELDEHADLLKQGYCSYEVYFKKGSADVDYIVSNEGIEREQVIQYIAGPMQVRVLATSEPHAAKIAMERRAAYLANT